MKSRIAGIAVGLVLASFVISPTPTYATSATFFGPIVPAACHCDNQMNPAGGTITTAPDFGCVLDTLHNAMNFGVTLATILFTIYLVITGFSFMTSGGSPGAVSKAKDRFTNVFVGLAVLLCAWLIVDFVMKTVYDQGKFGPWNAILAGQTEANRCIVVRTPSPLTNGQIISGNPTGVSSTGGVGGEVGSGSSNLDVTAAVDYLESHYTGTSSNHRCLAAIQLAFQAADGGSLDCPGNGTSHYAGNCGPLLTNLGFASIGSSDPNPQPGDIIVVPPNQYSDAGHIAMFTGSHWISDFVQSSANPYPSPQPPAQFYRP